MLLTRHLYWFTRCMMLHPITFPNKGPIIEQYLAEEAIGLAKSLEWSVVKGPFWGDPKIHNTIRPNFVRSKEQTKNMIYVQPQHDGEIRDGDYIKTSLGSAYIRASGMEMAFDESESDGDMYKQWRDKLLRESLANSSLIKTRRTTKKFYFTKGKLNTIANYLSSSDADCIFINVELDPVQVKNLQKVLQAKMNGLVSANKYEAQDGDTEIQTEYNSQNNAKKKSATYRTVKVFDRFSIILQIFAKRTTSKLARMQVELSYLNYLKTRLVREGSVYSANLSMFKGDLMKAEEVNLEVISAKQRRVAHTLGGEGQSQLQMERRRLKEKEAQIRKNISQEARMRQITLDKNKRKSSIAPVVALVGYTNVGKSAFLNNLMKKEEVESKDLLFQTLKTTARMIEMPSGSKMMLLDTIGFITNLPVQMVQCFKGTLQQIAHADIVIHLRDISHPQNELQKQSVMNILKDLKFEEQFYTTKMLEVWNKIDLIPKQQLNNDGIPQISCLTGHGIKNLLTLIEKKLALVYNHKRYQIKYHAYFHGKVVEFLKEIAYTSYNLDVTFNYQPSYEYPNGCATLFISLDQSTYFQLMKCLHPPVKRNRNSKGMPPKEGW